MASWLMAAGVEDTRALLLYPAQELRFLPRLGTRALMVLDRLKTLGVAPGCLAEPVAPRATDPPQLRALDGGRQEPTRKTYTDRQLEANAKPW